MHDTITITHNLASFSVTEEPRAVEGEGEIRFTVTSGEMESEVKRQCDRCGGVMHVHQRHTVRIQHVALVARPHLLSVTYVRTRCTGCGHITSQDLPFKDPSHRITKHLRYQAIKYLAMGLTLSEVSRLLHIHPAIVKEIDKSRLESLFPKGPPKGYSTHIAVDEFLLHRGHRYATVVIDVESGDVLFCEEGKKKEQVLHFMQAMGKRWMSHVQAVSMDMNAQYDSAFREWAPHVRIVYDLFHIVKLYNDSVITLMRRRKQHELKEQDRETEYQLFKNIRFVLTASRSTLQQQDAQARENNWELQEKFLKKGLSLPPGRRLMRVGKEKRLDDLLSQNTDFAVAYILLEQLKLAFAQSDRRNLEHGMHDWMKLARQSKVPEIIKFASTIDTHLEGILNHADHPISSGKLEGTNNLIKTIRRKAYGFHDTQYFFLKIMEASRRPPAAYRSHKKMS